MNAQSVEGMYELRFDKPVHAADVIDAVFRLDGQTRKVVIDEASVDSRPGIFIHDGNPPEWDPIERARKIYLHVDYNGPTTEKPIEGSGTHFNISGSVVTPELVEQVQAELSGK
ncbi:hypothetical protein HYU14_06885 [Candidatus Woesearchaeota archaeon]|nr:hypothetical protein [Candidatus Woesearchaeota archaeon]